MLKTLKCEGRVVWVYRKTRWIALSSTDLTLSASQIIELYGARCKIESGFKEPKQEVGSAESLTRNPFAVANHLYFCVMASTVSWIYTQVGFQFSCAYVVAYSSMSNLRETLVMFFEPVIKNEYIFIFYDNKFISTAKQLVKINFRI